MCRGAPDPSSVVLGISGIFSVDAVGSLQQFGKAPPVRVVELHGGIVV